MTLGGTGTEVDLRMLVEHICHRTLESRRRTSCPARAVVGPGSRVRFPITRGPFVSGDDPGQADDDVPGLRGARGVMPPIVIGLAEAGWTGTIERASGRSDRMPAMRIGIRHRNPAQGRASARRRGRQGARVEDRQLRRDRLSKPGAALRPRTRSHSRRGPEGGSPRRGCGNGRKSFPWQTRIAWPGGITAAAGRERPGDGRLVDG